MALRHQSGQRWRTNRALLERQGRGCWICRAFGRPEAIDYALPPHDPGAFEADHLVPKSKGGSDLIDNLDATHRACNIWRGDRSVEEVLAIARRQGGVPQVTPTTDW